MYRKRGIIAGGALAALIVAGASVAQRFRSTDASLDARWGVPTWEVDPRFKHDVFTFVRIQYTSEFEATGNYPNAGFGRRGGRRRGGGGFGGYGGGGNARGNGDYNGTYGRGWGTDGPQSDLNFSFRLQQLTTLKVNPNPVVLRFTDETLFDYPFIYMIEPGTGSFYLTNPEITALRRYLLNGGFMMVDDFWGDWEWDVFYAQIQRVFPGREPVELPITHEIFHTVYNLKQKPQVPAIGSVTPEMVARGITWEGGHGPSGEQVHIKAIFDDKGRMMVIICHNTDLGDGWEREGVDEWYFHEFSENKSYPMGINIVTYAMTH